ncbi:hypothetical protein Rxycam_00145 [Rubrobacter xylanophilus DSM 9941]|uniref:hypothetical protein n=1 Tax=Rubrobacter xylanophilus TaxID=49319 RepID=UPI001C63DD6E|nr:hypothetical protein [Rubrobacter xylanophilus]QYJ14349.1 hypothetical protein Rxycam_00145 [Rubrobacter xylanophilus DSM 9941]
MAELRCTARRVGDLESRNEEYELAFSVDGSPGRTTRVGYQAARAYEINEALEACVEAARRTIEEAGLSARPTDEALSQFAWRAMQSAKYEGGSPKTSSLSL